MVRTISGFCDEAGKAADVGGSVAQIGLRTGFPFPQTDSTHSFRYGNAERREAVQDGDTNLELGDLTVELQGSELM